MRYGNTQVKVETTMHSSRQPSVNRLRPAHSQAGFSLIEIIITVFILSIGILGVMGMQTQTMKASNDNYYRSQASILAQDIIGRMRVNISDAYTWDGSDPGSANDCVGAINTCNATQMAAFDIAQWNQHLNASNLPNVAAEIDRTGATNNGSNNIYTISIYWNERGNTATGKDCDPQDADDMSCLRITAVI